MCPQTYFYVSKTFEHNLNECHKAQNNSTSRLHKVKKPILVKVHICCDYK